MEHLIQATSYDDFDTQDYYTRYRRKGNGIDSCITFVLDSLHDLFKTGKVSGNRLLDVGTGVSLLSFLSASRYVNEIHLSDYLTRHLYMLQQWVDGEDIDMDLVQYILGKEQSNATKSRRLCDLRNMIKSVQHIDVNKSYPLEKNIGVVDIITSCFCLEVATKNASDYTSALANLSTLLKSGGHLVLCGTLNEEYYIVGKYKFWNANISKDDLYAALLANGYKVIFWQEMCVNKSMFPDFETTYSDFKTMFVVGAQKQ